MDKDSFVQRWGQDERYLAVTRAIAGQPTVRLVITTRSTSDVTLFAGLRDLTPDGSATLPSQLVLVRSASMEQSNVTFTMKLVTITGWKDSKLQCFVLS